MQPDTYEVLKDTLTSSSTVQVFLPANQHANLDSLPFRYGIHFQHDQYLQLSKLSNFAPGKDEGFIVLDANFSIKGDFQKNQQEEYHGRFVLLKQSHGDKGFKVVTVWRNESRDEFNLSELMKSLRKAGKLSPSDLLELHPRYLSGELNTIDKLFDTLVNQGIAASMSSTDLEIIKAKLDEQYEKEIRLRDIAKQAVEGLKAEEARSKEKDIENMKLRKQLGLKEEELERYKMENSSANNRSEVATLSDEDILIKVNLDVLHRGSLCTELVFANEVKKYMKVSTFDPSLKISQKAKSLEGKKVKTTCWDPVNEPGKWSNQDYFRNIYEVQN